MFHKSFKTQKNKLFTLWNQNIENEVEGNKQLTINDLITVQINRNNLPIQTIGSLFTIESAWLPMSVISDDAARAVYETRFNIFWADLIPFIRCEIIHRVGSGLPGADLQPHLPASVDFKKQTIYEVKDIVGQPNFKEVIIHNYLRIDNNVPSNNLTNYQTKLVVTFLNPKQYL